MEGGNFNKKEGESTEELIDGLVLYEEKLNKLVFKLRKVIDEIRLEGGNKRELEILKTELKETKNNILSLNKYIGELLRKVVNDIK